MSTKEKDSAVLNGKKIQVYGGTLNASGASVGIKADKSVTISGGAINVHSDASGIKISDKEDTNFYMYDGTLFIETKKHGIVADYVTITGVGEAKKNVAYPFYIGYGEGTDKDPIYAMVTDKKSALTDTKSPVTAKLADNLEEGTTDLPSYYIKIKEEN